MFDNSPERTGLQATLVPDWAIMDVWEAVKPMLKRATDLSLGRYEVEDVQARLINREFQLWVIFDENKKIIAAITSAFTEYPQGRFLSGQFLGGDRLGEWQDMFCDLFERWARDNQCKAIELAGRAGWRKALEPNGYKEVFRTYQRDL